MDCKGLAAKIARICDGDLPDRDTEDCWALTLEDAERAAGMDGV